MTRKNDTYNRIIITVSFVIALTFFLFGSIIFLANLKNILSISGFSLSGALFAAVGVYIAYQSAGKFIKFYDQKSPYRLLLKFLKENNAELIITAIIFIFAMSFYHTGFYLEYGFIIQMVVLVPVFIFQSLSKPVEVFVRRYLDFLYLNTLFLLIVPVLQFYYVFSVVKIAGKFFRKKS